MARSGASGHRRTRLTMAKEAETETSAPPEPRASYALHGLEAGEQAFVEALQTGRLHHAWLLSGPRGVGKATLAYRIARRVLGAEADPSFGLLGAHPDDPVCRSIESGSNPDLFVMERPWDDARARRRGEIPVDRARAARAFFASTAAGGAWRVCVIDAADEMNLSAANAILKTLEEPPPQALLLLVAHAPGRVLATLRSRCRQLRLTPPGETFAAEVLKQTLNLGAAEAETLARLSGGRPGYAVALAAAGWQALEATLADALGRRGGAGAADALADKLVAKGAEPARATFFQLLSERLRAQARAGAGEDAARFAEAWRAVGDLERSLDALHLDPKLVILEALALARRAAA